ncbi:hypothetical protein ACJJTC_003917 [Scirpophaga incertulas]
MPNDNVPRRGYIYGLAEGILYCPISRLHPVASFTHSYTHPIQFSDKRFQYVDNLTCLSMKAVDVSSAQTAISKVSSVGRHCGNLRDSDEFALWWTIGGSSHSPIHEIDGFSSWRNLLPVFGLLHLCGPSCWIDCHCVTGPHRYCQDTDALPDISLLYSITGREGRPRYYECEANEDNAQHTLEFCLVWKQHAVLASEISKNLSLAAIIKIRFYCESIPGGGQAGRDAAMCTSSHHRCRG